MTNKKSDTLSAEIEGIQAEADRFIGKLETELATVKSQRLTGDRQNQLEGEIERARTMYDGLLKSKRAEMELYRKVEAQESKQAEAQIDAQARAEKERIRGEMATAWVQSGGSLDTFDQNFEALYQEELRRRTTDRLDRRPDENHARRAGRDVITSSF